MLSNYNFETINNGIKVNFSCQTKGETKCRFSILNNLKNSNFSRKIEYYDFLILKYFKYFRGSWEVRLPLKIR